jgi:hypothetical protein
MTLNTWQGDMVEVLSLLVMTVLAFGAGGLLTGLSQLHYTTVGVVANDAIDDYVFALKEFFILFMMLDKAIGGVDLFNRVAPVALATFFGIAVDFHFDSLGIADMQTAWTVT